MSQTRAIKVVTFDLDDTLWDISAVIVRAEYKLRRWLADRYPHLAGAFDRNVLADLRTQIVQRDPTIAHRLSDLRMAVLTRALERRAYAAADATVVAREAFAVFLDARHEVAYFDDAHAVLESLRARYRLGALSNGNADIVRLGLDRYFSFAFSAASVGASKPEPAMFQAALAHTHAAPREMVHVGDHHEHDIDGARRLGIHTIWVNIKGGAYPGAEPASAEVNRLRDLPDAIAGIENRLDA